MGHRIIVRNIWTVLRSNGLINEKSHSPRKRFMSWITIKRESSSQTEEQSKALHGCESCNINLTRYKCFFCLFVVQYSTRAHFPFSPHFYMGIPISIYGAQWNSSPFPHGDRHMETGIDTSPYGKGKSPFPYREPDDTAPRFHMVITIWKWG